MKVSIDSVKSLAIQSEYRHIGNSADDGTLHDYQSGEAIRPATPAEIEASRNAGPEGVIEIDGRSCYVSR